MTCLTDVMEKVKELLGEVTGDPTLPGNLTGSTDIINEVGLDSIQMINFVLMIEDEFGIEIDFESFDYTIFSSLDLLSGFISDSLNCMVAS